LIKLHHPGESNTLPTEPVGEFQEMLTEFLGHFGEQNYANSEKCRQANCEMKTDPNCKILFYSPYHISPDEEEELQRQIDKTICCGWIQPSRSNFGAAV